MGIFDGVFNNDPQQAAAAAQIQGINAGYGQLSDLFGQGRGAISNAYGSGLGYLGTGWNAATNAAIPAFGAGANAINNAINTGTGQIYGGLGGANAALAGGYNAATNAANQNYYASLSPFMQNYAQANLGTNALGNALGLNGPAGSDAAVKAFQANPGYQFGLNQGEAAIQAAAQASGMGASGNTLNAADQFAQNYANQNWQNYVNNLSPYLGYATNSAGGIASGLQGLGSLGANLGMQYGQLGSNNIMNAAQQANANQLNMGNWLNTNAMNLGSLLSGNAMNYGNLANTNQMNLGNALGSSFTNQGNAAYGAQTSIGNANANADLAQAQANANILGALGGVAKAGIGLLSDESMKDDIERVGTLFDGQPIYRYLEKGDPRHKIGLIAQEVEQRDPDAVLQFTPHIKGVDYRRATNAAAEIGRYLEVT